MKRFSFVAVLVVGLSVALAACGDSTSTPAASGATIAPIVTTSVAITSPAISTAANPATTASATTMAGTTQPPVATTSGSADSTTYPVTVTDGAGVSLTLAKKPERIICLHVICLDILAELGVEPIAIAERDASTAQDPRFFGDKAKDWTKIKPDANGGIANLEVIASLKPDLVLGYQAHFTAIRDTKVAPLFGNSATGAYQDRIAEMKTVARLLDRMPQAEAAEKHFYDRLAAYAAKSPKNVSVMVSNSVSAAPFMLQIATEKTPTCALFSSVAKCDWKLPDGIPNNGGFLNTSMEKILEYDPDVIIIRVYADEDRKRATDELPTNSFWKELKAVKNKRVYTVDTGLWGGFGTRMLNTMLDEGMPLIYPNVFPKALP